MKTTNTQKAKKQIDENRELIIIYTGMTGEEYNELFLELACQWAENFTQDKEASKFLKSDPVFWGFWAISFDKQNEDFISQVKFHVERLKYYLLVHSKMGINCLSDQRAIRDCYEAIITRNMLASKSNAALMEIAFHNSLKSN
jgi:hypothetical protein